MTTFSQMVDEMVRETRRMDLRQDIARYLNQSIRELHFDPVDSGAVLYEANQKELLLTSDVESGFGWLIPDVSTFQHLGSVQYQSIWGRSGRNPYAIRGMPGPGFEANDYAYYQANGRIFFKGYGGIGGKIALFYYQFPRGLHYYVEAQRPAIYQEGYGFTYGEGFRTTQADFEQAQLLTTNWLLLRWKTVLEEGLRAKVYKRLSDDGRQRTSYSMYQQLRRGLYTSEIARTDVELSG